MMPMGSGDGFEPDATISFTMKLVTLAFYLALFLGINAVGWAKGTPTRPNFVVIFADDLGYGDLTCYSEEAADTEHIDRLAAEGFRSTNFFIPANVCSPSRAALLTGRYPNRCGFPVARNEAHPKYRNYGLASEELTIPELLASADYESLMVGKWHLGLDVVGSHPLDAGFDKHLGIASNYEGRRGGNFDTLFRGREVEARNVPFTELTRRYTDEAVNFIQQKKSRPFFLYFAHHIPHSPIAPRPEFVGTSGRGKYGDFVRELDHSTGRIMDALEQTGLAENTLVVFTSDNGPTRLGSTGPMRGGKYHTLEGGHRVPGIFRWPGTIPSGQVSNTLLTSMDLLPLFCGLAGVPLPDDRVIDGKDIASILTGKADQSPHEFTYYYNGINLQAVRSGKWKLHLPRTVKDQPFWARASRGTGVFVTLDKPVLFDLESDPAEQSDLSKDRPDIVDRLMREADRIRIEIGDVGVTGTDQRKSRLKNPQERDVVGKKRPAALATARETETLATRPPDRPKAVVLIYADDLGFGDLSCYGATKIKTPHIDRLAKSGRLFTDAHSPSAVCTPSRYGLLTGEYPWRIGSRSPVFAKQGLVVDPEKNTLADIFQAAGYSTACIGKWHLGFGIHQPDWNAELKPGPQELGFDYYYGVPVVNSHPPFVYVENHRVVGWDPTDPLVYAANKPNPHAQPFPEKNTQPMRNGLGFSGGKAAHTIYRDEEVATHLTKKAVAWMEAQQGKPFFLYLATTNIHHPFTPHPRFQGTSEAGIYGDFVHELDWIVGEVTKTLQKMGLAEDALVIFTSDNGGMLNGGGSHAWELGHRLNGDLQGFKFGVWEGGHRVPFIACWPKQIAAATKSDALLSSLDLPASLAALLGVELDSDEAADSIDQSEVLFGHRTEPLRRELMLQPYQLSHLGLRQDNWVYIPARGSGGFGNGQGSLARSGNMNSDLTPGGEFKPDAPAEQLYNLEDDPRQQQNVIDEHADVARVLAGRLAELKSPGSIRPLGNLRFDFESGDLQGWRVTDGEFEQPVDSAESLPRFPDKLYGRKGKFHLSTLATTDQPGVSDKQTGVIESPRFRLKGDKITFLIGGGFRDDVHLAVCDAAGNEVARSGGENGPRMVRRVIELPRHSGEVLCLRLVDQAKSGWGHLVFDDFSADGELVKGAE